jgi:hypothetical protein
VLRWEKIDVFHTGRECADDRVRITGRDCAEDCWRGVPTIDRGFPVGSAPTVDKGSPAGGEVEIQVLRNPERSAE